MKNNRRDFLRISGLGGLGLISGTLLSCNDTDLVAASAQQQRGQRFNMSGYAAPKIETVRIGFIGLGSRGPSAVKRMSQIEGVEIKAICDLLPKEVEKVSEMLVGTPHTPVRYSGSPEIWKEMVDREDLDLIYIATPWEWHAPMALYSMEAGKHVGLEQPAAKTIDECWELVETSERTKKHCMMLENACYDFFELLTLNMARQGFFGEIIHGEGAYIHDLRELNFSKDEYQGMWRLKENIERNGNLYPSHGLGPICQVMNINRGDQLDYLTSLSSDDFHMADMAKKLAAEDDFYDPYVGHNYRGNMNTTTIKTKNGKSIMVQHDVTSPRPYSRIHLISGTKAFARKYPSERISTGHDWLSEAEMEAIKDKYTPEIVKKVGDLAKQIGGHGGMDFMMDWRLIDCLRNGLPLDQDVYDAALWTAVIPLSVESVKNRAKSMDIPDFTNGAWKENAPVDLSLAGGGTTKVLLDN